MDNNRKSSSKSRFLLASIVIVIIGVLVTLKLITPALPVMPEETPMQNANESETIEPSERVPVNGDGEYSIKPGLSEGFPRLETPAPLQVLSGEPLTPEEIDALFERLPALPISPEEQSKFNYPVELLPPPRPGTIIKEDFPPYETQPTPEVGSAKPLEVVRFAPEGEIPIAPFISITFNQPMVPLGTIGDITSLDIPVTIDPPLSGAWHWLGTKTLTFEYTSKLMDRLPKATSFKVTVPEGTKSISGGVLAKTVTWTFNTPPPKVLTMYPQNVPQPLEPLIFMEFDQRIDPEAVLKTIQLYAGNVLQDLRLATDEDVKEDEQVNQYVKDAQAGRWLAFKSSQPFPADTAISVTVGPGTPSAEGPFVTTSAQSYGFTTYAPLKITDYGCYWDNSECPPLSPFTIEFNNPLDTKTFKEEMVSVKPEIPGMVVNMYGNTIEIGGETKGQTTYTVTISSNLKDTFNQQLGKDEKLNFKVGKAEPKLYGPGELFVTIDPGAKKPVFPVYALNYQKLAVKIYSVQPSDWEKFTKYYREWRQTDRVFQLPGKEVFNKTINLDIPDDTLSEVNIDLTPYLNDGFGHFIVKVEPPEGMFESDLDQWNRFSQTIFTWVQVTQIGVDAYSDYSDMVVWTTNLGNGSPLSNVQIKPNKGKGFKTGQDGLIRVAIPAGATYLVATKGNDNAMLLHSAYAWEETGWVPSPPSDSLRWYVFDDRTMYRPGEEVHIKGWMRRVGERQNGDVSLVGSEVTAVSYQLIDPQGNAINSGQADVNSLGGFDFAFTIPQTVNLGYARLNLNALGNLSGLNGNSYTHSFQIQEFRRPEFEVNARNETTGPYFVGDSALLAVEAKYYAGGPLPNAEVTWEVETSPGKYSPPNWPDFIFGEWRPWWWDSYRFETPWQDDESNTETYYGLTDESGLHYLKLDLSQTGNADKKPQPMSVVAQAMVMDVNRQAWASTTTLLVHPANLYIGLRSERYFVERGTPIKVDFIVTDLDGNAMAEKPVVITAARLEWKLKDGEWGEEEVDIQKCSKLSRLEPDTCSFETPIGGSYRITAVVTDELGRKNQTLFTRWVSGGQQPPSRAVEQEEVTLIPDKETYQPGDTAQILVQSPFSPAEGLLTVSRNGILEATRFQMKGSSTTLSIPLKDEHIPNLNIQVDLVGSADRMDDKGVPLKKAAPRPAFATAALNLAIPPLHRTLSLQVTPDASQIEPGGETVLRIKLKDASGQPVSDAELAVVVVDEAILALSNYQMVDPISVFYAERASGLMSIYGRSSIILANPESLTAQLNEESRALGGIDAMMPTATAMMEAPAMSNKAGSDEFEQPSISVRSDFNPLAIFSPTVRTGSNGEARVYLKLPDNLTRYRIMVVAVDETGRQFGMGESNLTARLPLMVRPSAPRFLNFGDKFELPVILQNQTDKPMTVEIVARATNLELEKPGQRVTVPANDRIEIRFPASTQRAGKARVQIAAVSGNYADAAVIEIPIYTPATTEAFATYGVIDEGAISQSILHPADVFPQYGGLEITTSSTALQALTDAVIYLVDYPFECTEQLASRILAIAALKDVLSAFESEGLPTPEELKASVTHDIEKLKGMQNYDGGFPYWRRGFESIPFNTIHVAHALFRANQKGFEVPDELQQSVLNYLEEIESHYPDWYTLETRQTLSAYALYVRNFWGDRDEQKAQRLFRDAGIENLSMEAIGWLWPVIDNENQLEEIRHFVSNHEVETAGAANFTTGYSDQTYLLLSSNRRTDAILLDAIMEDDPESDLIPKVVNGLLAHRIKGRWSNTQENVFVLLALDRYFNTYESQTPDFAARFWLGNTYAGSHEFRGRSTEIHETLIPMSYVLKETSIEDQAQDLIISKEGAGRLYYRLGMRYAPTDLDLDALEAGFVVQRTYEAVDDPKDVSQDKDGTWHIKAGARVRVHITFVADNRRYHVALVDPLPAGLEIINPALAVSQDVPQEDPIRLHYGWWWWRTWYEHQNLRDDRAEVFTSLLWDGVYEYKYYARATTPGTFIVPPTKAEEMYSPEVFGRSGSDRVIVE